MLQCVRVSSHRGKAANLFDVLLVALRARGSSRRATGVPEGVVVLQRVFPCPWNHRLQTHRSVAHTWQPTSPPQASQRPQMNSNTTSTHTFFLAALGSFSSSSFFSFSQSFDETLSWSWSPLSSSFRLQGTVTLDPLSIKGMRSTRLIVFNGRTYHPCQNSAVRYFSLTWWVNQANDYLANNYFCKDFGCGGLCMTNFLNYRGVPFLAAILQSSSDILDSISL